MSNAATSVLTHEAAQKIVAECVRAATAQGVAASIAVVDAGGHRVAFVRMTGASFHSQGIAEDKAYTAASFGTPTGALAQSFLTLPEHVGEELRRQPRLVLLKGGIPLRVGGRILGAIGVSGASEEMDEEIAMAGAAAIANLR